MDLTRIATAGILALVMVFGLWLGYRFLGVHWEDIKALAIVALVLVGTVTLVDGSWKMTLGR